MSQIFKRLGHALSRAGNRVFPLPAADDLQGQMLTAARREIVTQSALADTYEIEARKLRDTVRVLQARVRAAEPQRCERCDICPRAPEIAPAGSN